jgi:hypothetical protein
MSLHLIGRGIKVNTYVYHARTCVHMHILLVHMYVCIYVCTHTHTEGSCEHGNEPSGSIKCWEVLEWLPILAASQEGLSSGSK